MENTDKHMENLGLCVHGGMHKSCSMIRDLVSCAVY